MIIQIKVHASSGREEIIKISEDSYKVYLKKPAKGNKANIELVKLLSKYFKSQVKIIKGLNNNKKIIKLE